jgi:hypothetical protein
MRGSKSERDGVETLILVATFHLISEYSTSSNHALAGSNLGSKINYCLNKRRKIKMPKFILTAVMPKIIIATFIVGLAATSIANATICWECLGGYLYSGDSYITNSPCPGGGVSKTTTNTDYYQYGSVTTTYGVDCDGNTFSKQTSTITGGVAKLDIQINNGDIVISSDVNVYVDIYSGNDVANPTPIRSDVSVEGNNSFQLLQQNLESNLPYIFVVRDATTGNVLRIEKIILYK